MQEKNVGTTQKRMQKTLQEPGKKTHKESSIDAGKKVCIERNKNLRKNAEK